MDDSGDEDFDINKSVFLDQDEESDNDEEVIMVNKSHIRRHKTIIDGSKIFKYYFLDNREYYYKTWRQCFPDSKVSLRSLVFNSAWDEFFTRIEKKSYFKKIENFLSDLIVKNKNIFPYGELVFNSFNTLSPDNIRVIIMGQDPYPGVCMVGKKKIPNASGLSFYVPIGSPVSKSLNNIYENLLKHNHIQIKPNSGCLAYWILQGCFLINATFTTIEGKKNEHQDIWKCFTNDLMAYLTEKYQNLVFLVWGKNAHYLCQKINPKEHCIITSSHPSPMSCNGPMTGSMYGEFKDERNRKRITFPSFAETDHFGKANKYLKSVGKNRICWSIIN